MTELDDMHDGYVDEWIGFVCQSFSDFLQAANENFVQSTVFYHRRHHHRRMMKCVVECVKR